MRHLLINLAVLFCAVSIFGSAAVYSASALQVSESLPTEELVQTLEYGSMTNDLYITDLDENDTNDTPSLSSSSEGKVSSGDTSSSTSSEPSSKTSSREESSAFMSSIPTYTNANTSSKSPSSLMVSSAPPSSMVSSTPPSSMVSSTPPSSMVSSAPPSSMVSSEPPSSMVSSEPPASSDTASGQDDVLLDMLAGAVQREIIGVNTPMNPNCREAYKAQAIASHSYMEYYFKLSGRYPTMSYCTPSQETLDLVAEVLNLVMYSNGKPINASYHASSGGHTQSASYVWTGDIAYLRGVTSEYDQDAASTTLPISEVEQKLLSYGIPLSGGPEAWFDLASATLSDGGFVDYIPICGQMVRGRVLRENILGVTNLRSPKITDISVVGDNFVFSTLGFGHGAGMSQNGARGYAQAGWSYSDILNHYYTGISIETKH